MKELIVEKAAEVRAPAAAIWEQMMAVKEWPSWQPFITKARIASDYENLSCGSRIRFSLMAGGPASLPLTAAVTEFDRPRRLAWTGGLHGWFYAEHSFDFEDQGGGVTRVVSRERFTGHLLPLVLLVVPPADLEELHLKWVQAIKERMEGKPEAPPAAPSH